LGIRDSFKTVLAQWAHAEFLCVPVLALSWLGLSYWFARRRIIGTAPGILESIVRGRSRSFSVLAGIAVLAETVVLAIRDYGNENPTFVDAWQDALRFRPTAQVAALSVLLLGSLWVWRREDGFTKNGKHASRKYRRSRV
jgi:hypothetical protein